MGMIVVYENQAELPSRDVSCNDYAQSFNLHPPNILRNFPGK